MAHPIRNPLAALLAGAALACCLGAAPAHAATYCVQTPNCPPDASKYYDLQDALDLAAASDAADFIELGPHTFSTKSGYKYDAGGVSGNHVTIHGAGDDTVLNTYDPTTSVLGLKVLELHGAGTYGSHVSDLRVIAPAGPLAGPANGLYVAAATAERVDVRFTDAAADAEGIGTGVRLLGAARLYSASVTLPPGRGTAIAGQGARS